MKISLTKRAERNYYSIKEYVIQEWGEQVAETLEQKIIAFLDLLEIFPEIGVLEISDKEIRSFQLTKHIRIFYRIKGQELIILAFFDVRQSPSKKPK